jgi:D-alanyl-D-alanine endopeptidase (penicillin-binding protein 7)
MALLKKLLVILSFLPGVTFAGSFVVFDASRAVYEQSYNAQEIRSIASITKLFTAVTVLNSGVDMSELVTVQGKSSGRFIRGSKVSRIDLFKAMLISSDNLASESLAHSLPGGYAAFLPAVQQTIRQAGLGDTVITDATGLLATNISTAEDITKFLIHSQKYSLITEVSSMREHSVRYQRGKKTHLVRLRNTNPAVHAYDNIVLSKTGWTNAAGRCVAMMVQQDTGRIAVVVLGQPDLRTRTAKVNNLIASL